MTAQRHVPVMLNEVVAALGAKDGGIYVDATFGAGGYSRALLDAAGCRVWGIDRDPAAIARGTALADAAEGRLTLRHGRFGSMDRILREGGVEQVDGVALDIGVSSPQLDDPARGFSFRLDGPLDMRMDASGPSAADLVNNLDETTLADIVWRHGEERHSRRIARAIVQARDAQPITRTLALADIVRRAAGGSRDGIDPATRTFQALRISVNEEIDELRAGLGAAERLLAPGGRLAVVSFHSLEDRVVKAFLRERSGEVLESYRHLPAAAEGRPASFTLPFRRAQRPSAGEITRNPRARSARLRVGTRTAQPAWPAMLAGAA
ncbi:MAG: 16S rRNA (cytosine(1402)-N(4))-methyltransferase RsmH [Alphaproteobacteria bacterium]|nr:16S rRNA (cytosine(1402)-N(4))-methyltransferase RsmH [Alphaproteobacteria bacterium]